MPNFVLYSTDGCHLCDEAKVLIEEHAPTVAQQLDVQDIARNDTLYEHYQWSIPVLKSPQGTELNWPFNAQQLREFLS